MQANKEGNSDSAADSAHRTPGQHEGLDEWVEGEVLVKHIVRLNLHIDYVRYTINGFEVDPTTTVPSAG